jgi:hypothetical protein
MGLCLLLWAAASRHANTALQARWFRANNER